MMTVDWRKEGPLSGSFKLKLEDPFGKWLHDMAGVHSTEGSARLELSGSPLQPKGLLSVSIASMAFGKGLLDRPVPPLRDIRLEARLDRDEVSLKDFRFRVNESGLEGQASLPTRVLEESLSLDRPARGGYLLKHLAGEVNLKGWRAVDWEEVLPAVLRRSGTVDGWLQLKPDLDLTGSLNFKGFGLRPTEALPPVDKIEGRFALSDRVLNVEGGSAEIGGNPIRFGGWLNLKNLEAAEWEFSAKGDNIPLVRTTDMILRSDVDLTASRLGEGNSPLLAGQLKLRDSTLLLEFDPLSPGVRTGPRKAPPYFSVPEGPFAPWRFDLSLQGEDFLRIRSPYFQGLLSADFALGGTFAQPILIGMARTRDAVLRFPGAKVKIDRGEAFIEEGRTEVVQLALTGVARTSSYVISMDVSNTLDNPRIEFESTPGLSNAEIVRLLATGSARSGGAGTVGLYFGQGLLGSPGMNESIMDRLTIDIGENVTEEGKETIGVRYDLGGDYFLKGEYDEYDAYNLDLVWSLFRK